MHSVTVRVFLISHYQKQPRIKQLHVLFQIQLCGLNLICEIVRIRLKFVVSTCTPTLGSMVLIWVTQFKSGLSHFLFLSHFQVFDGTCLCVVINFLSALIFVFSMYRNSCSKLQPSLSINVCNYRACEQNGRDRKPTFTFQHLSSVLSLDYAHCVFKFSPARLYLDSSSLNIPQCSAINKHTGTSGNQRQHVSYGV